MVRRKGTKSRRKRTRSRKGVPASALNYAGPIVHRPQSSAKDSIMLNVATSAVFDSTGTGTIVAVYSSDPTGQNEWTDVAALWSTYRVLGFYVEFIPNASAPVASVMYAPLLVVTDRENATALTSYTVAGNFQSCSYTTLNRKHRHTAKMVGADTAQFGPIGSSPPQPYWIKLYASGLNNTYAYGIINIVWLTQVMGRR